MYCYSILLTLFCSCQASYVMVTVDQGVLRGERRVGAIESCEYYSFKGIPYAAPPIGRLRFQAPQPAVPWSGIRDALQHGSTCVQLDFFTGEYSPGNEDCLFLNIYTPTMKPKSPLAVLFFIHGGGFQSGSGNDDLYGPDFFMCQNIILVTINYRLDALGFLSLESEEIPGNAGLKDQVAALKWVRKNIMRFGGDPNMVTISGQSAGGASCTLHIVSPMSKGLFHRAIALSGTFTLESLMQTEPRRRAIALGKVLGYETENVTALFHFFQTVPAHKLIGARPNIMITEQYYAPILAKMYYFTPTVEKKCNKERFLIESPTTSLENGRVYGVDLMLGNGNGEGLLGLHHFEDTLIDYYNTYPELLTPRLISNANNIYTILKLSDSIKNHYFGKRAISIDVMPEFVKYFSDTFAYQIRRYARDVSIVNSKKTYLYTFADVTERNIYGSSGWKYGIFASAHMDFLMYLFQANMYDIPINTDSVSYTMIVQTTTLLANFIKLGNPTPDKTLGVIWQEYNHTTQSFLDIGIKLVEGVHPQAAMMQFWQGIYDQAGVPFYYVQ